MKKVASWLLPLDRVTLAKIISLRCGCQSRWISIPKGLRPSAQGWRASAYLGCAFGTGNNANGVVAHSPTLRQRRYVGLRIKRIEQPQRGCGRLCASGNRHNRVAVGNVCWTVTQGSAFRATLGFGTQPRWGRATRSVQRDDGPRLPADQDV